MRTTTRALLLLAGFLALSFSACGEEISVDFAKRHLKPWFKDSLVEAVRRVDTPECRRVLTDFRDESGRTLLENLETTGLSATEYLSRIYFTGGRGSARCQTSSILATTSPGSRVVFVCDSFFDLHHGDSAYAANTLIHEMLHTLGLGENPPSPRAITERVEERCGR